MASSDRWTRKQLLVAFCLYCQMPFGKMHSRNPEIIKFSHLMGRSPSALAMKLTNIASLDPAIRATGRKGLDGASAADRAMWQEMEQQWEKFAIEAQLVMESLGISEPEIGEDITEKSGSYRGETRLSEVNVRIGQHFFRRAVLSAYNYRCCITGLSVTPLLVASHIVPWRSDTENRLNPRNGLCLSSLHDRAFDMGLITITHELKVKISSRHFNDSDRFFRDALLSYDGKLIETPEKFSPDLSFIDYHQKNIFKE